MEIDECLEKLIKNGSSIKDDDLNKIKKDVALYIKTRDISKIINMLLCEFEESTYKYLKSNTINGISSSIYLNNNCNDYYLNISSGKSIQNNYINAYTEFDIASVTKLFTLFLIFKYEELGIINLKDKICDINEDFKYLDYTVLDIIKMSGSIITDRRIDETLNYKEAFDALCSVHPVNYNMSVNHYTDIGFIILGKIVESIIGMSFERALTLFLDGYGININNLDNIAGNGHLDKLPHDPKTRKLGGFVGSSGIFINSLNMAKFSNCIFNGSIISKKNLDKIPKKRFELYHDNRSYAGINIKHPLGIKKSATPNEYSNAAFSHQGFTGSSAIFDPINKIHNSILVDAINLNQKSKHPDFFKYYNLYHQEIVMITLKLYLVKEYYDKYEKEKIKILKII